MMEHSETQGAAQESAVDTATPRTAANRKVLHFMFGAQRMLWEEMAFTAEAMLERVRTEAQLFSEFSAKLASSHSVRDWNAMASECGQHQIEFVRRDCDRMLRHGERLIASTSDLLDNRP